MIDSSPEQKIFFIETDLNNPDSNTLYLKDLNEKLFALIAISDMGPLYEKAIQRNFLFLWNLPTMMEFYNNLSNLKAGIEVDIRIQTARNLQPQGRQEILDQKVIGKPVLTPA